MCIFKNGTVTVAPWYHAILMVPWAMAMSLCPVGYGYRNIIKQIKMAPGNDRNYLDPVISNSS